MKESPFFFRWLKGKAPLFGAFLLFSAILIGSFALYHLPLRAVIYPLFLCLLTGCILLIPDYLKKRSLHQTLRRMEGFTSEMLESLPEALSSEGEDYQAETLFTMMDYLFRRPLVEAFTTWDFEDHQWLKAPSGLVHSDGTPKKALLMLKEKLAGDWHTSADLITDENGCCELYGFRGDYELTCGDAALPFTLKKDMGETQIRL